MLRTTRLRHFRTGATLVEALVVMIAITVLLAVAAAGQPGFIDAPISRIISCRGRLSDLGKAMSMYAADHKDTFAGPNTSGADGQVTGGSGYTFDRTGTTPVSTHDWISPTLGRGVALPVNRAARTQFITNQFACPETTINNAAIFGNSPDAAQFAAAIANGGFRQVSYLSPSSFHYFGSTTAAAANRYQGVTLKSSFTTPVRVSDAYRPRLDLVGTQPGRKVYAADGTRFFDLGLLDLDISPNPSLNGFFTDSGPIVQTSAAYGRLFSGAPQSCRLSFRHGRAGASAEVNAAFFDGSVGRLTQAQTYTDASRWYPGGSVYNGSGATPESQAFHAPGSVLP